MITYTLLTSTLLLALASFFLLKTSVSKELSISWHGLLAGISLSIFTYLYGCWVYVSVYVKYAFGIAVIIILLGLFRKKKNASVRKWKMIPNLFILIVFGTLSVLYFTGTMGTPQTVDLSFPFKRSGQYFIFQGGKGLPTNYFHYRYRGAVYAVDIVKLNRFGNRANGIFSENLSDYETFSDTVYSPCDGVVKYASDENIDNLPPSRKRGPSNTNTVLLETDSFYVFMAHLQHKKVFVHDGDLVKAGDAIGLVGNSGFSLEPHLHIQVHQKLNDDPWYECAPLFIQFDGKTYLHFETIRK